jgi:hypothetical protein
MDKRVTTGDYWERDGMGIRVPVLHIALMIESKAKWAVDFLLTENKELASLIYWDFNKRIQFLNSLDALNDNEKGKFTLFQNIRNKLIHDLDAKSLVDCFRIMDKKPEDTILNLYRQDKSLPLEKQLYLAVQMLIGEIGNLLAKIEAFVLQSTKGSRAMHASKGYELVLLTLKDAVEQHSEQIKQHVRSGKPLSVEDADLIPVVLLLRVKDEAQKRFRKLLKEDYGVDLDKFDTEGGPLEERA